MPGGGPVQHERDDADAGVLERRRARLAAAGSEPGQQPRGRARRAPRARPRRRRGAPGAARDPSSSRQPLRRAGQAADRGAQPHVGAARRGHGGRQPAEPAGQPAEDGAGVRDRRRRGRDRVASSRLRERATGPASCGSVACRLSRSARPAYTPPSSGSTSRSTTSRPSRRPTRSPTATSSAVGPPGWTRSTQHPGQPGGAEHLAAGERREVARDAHHRAARQRAQPAAGPERGLAGGGADQLAAEPGVLRERDAVRHPGQHAVGALVDRQAADLADRHLAAEPRAGLEHDDPRVRAQPRHLQGRGQSRDAPADHGDRGGGSDEVRGGHVPTLGPRGAGPRPAARGTMRA